MLHGGPQPGQALVKSAAALDQQLATSTRVPGLGSKQQLWYAQERQAQHDEPAGGASTSGLQDKPRDRVKFAVVEASSGDGGWPGSGSQLLGDKHGGSTPVAVVSRTGFFSFTRPKHTDEEATASTNGQQPGEASLSASSKHGLGGAVSRTKSHTAAAAGQHHVGFDAPGSSARHKSQAASEAGSRAQSEAPSRSQSVTASGMSATLKGLFGGASSRLLGSIMGRSSGHSSKSDQSSEEAEELWFTSLDDFKPICHMLHRGRYMAAYFACANKTGQHFLLKKFDKHKMLPAEERGVRRAIAFSELLQHPDLVRMMGTWESDDTIFVVEEYVGKGDILNDCISHPDKYTERHVAVALARPLLQALAHLHANNIIHRSVLPENAYMGLDDVLRLGHLVLAIDQTSDRPKSRTTLLDYMAPEMLSVRPHNEHELALLADDSEDGDSSSSDASSEGGGGGRGGGSQCNQQHWRQQQQQEQQWEALQEPGQQREVPQAQLGVLGASSGGPVPSTAAAVRAHTEGVLLLTEGKPGEQPPPQDLGGSRHSQQQQQQQRQQQHQGSKQRAQLDPSRQASPDPAAQVQSAFQAAAAAAAVVEPAAAAERLAQGAGRAAGRRGSRAFLGPCGGTGRAEWEYQDAYDEKVDIWQLGCMLHELLCGSMPFELDSKLESAGLSLWADIEVLPGSVPPDCADFIQQALTKNPRARPSAQQLLQHPWLARCQAGEPWRDPIELEAARREAELSTFTGWVRIHAAAAAAAVSGILQHWQRGGRVAPAQTDSSSNRQRQSVDAPPDKDARSRGHSSTGFAASRGGVPDAHAAQHVLATLHAAC